MLAPIMPQINDMIGYLNQEKESCYMHGICMLLSPIFFSLPLYENNSRQPRRILGPFLTVCSSWENLKILNIWCSSILK